MAGRLASLPTHPLPPPLLFSGQDHVSPPEPGPGTLVATGGPFPPGSLAVLATSHRALLCLTETITVQLLQRWSFQSDLSVTPQLQPWRRPQRNYMPLSVLERFQERRVGGYREQGRQRQEAQGERAAESKRSEDPQRQRETETQRQRETAAPERAGRDKGSGRER